MKVKTEKPVVCVNCYRVGVPKYTIQKRSMSSAGIG